MIFSLKCSRKLVFLYYLFFIGVFTSIAIWDNGLNKDIIVPIVGFALFILAVLIYICKDVLVFADQIVIKFSFLPIKWMFDFNDIETVYYYITPKGLKGTHYIAVSLKNKKRKEFTFNYMRNNDMKRFYKRLVDETTLKVIEE